VRVAFSAKAEDQLKRLENYLAIRFYPENSVRFVQRIVEACTSIGHAPYQGTRRDDLRPGVRLRGFEDKVAIYFEIFEDRVRILSIMYGGREPRSIDLKFKDPKP
jgi:plasmid stabilization system protein ParE